MLFAIPTVAVVDDELSLGHSLWRPLAMASVKLTLGQSLGQSLSQSLGQSLSHFLSQTLSQNR